MAKKKKTPKKASKKKSSASKAKPVRKPIQLGDLIKRNQMLNLRGNEKSFALEQMISTAARALNLTVSQQVDLSAAVHAREAALNTQLGSGWAAPHATLDIDDRLCLVVGRSRKGIDYGKSDLGRVHLVFLFVSSPQTHDKYLNMLSYLATAFRGDDAQKRIEKCIQADTPRKLKVALGETVRKRMPSVSRRLPQVTRALIRHMLRFADDIKAETILLFSDVFKNPALLSSFINENMVLATRNEDVPEALEKKARGVVRLTRGDFAEESAVQLAMLAAGARGLLGDGGRVVAVCGEKNTDDFDTLRIETPKTMLKRIYGGGARSSNITSEVIERAIEILSELADEGREGKSVGTAMILGDFVKVREYCQQLTINPFHGYNDDQRSLLDPALEETVKEFALLDGAFVVDSEGVIQSAGTYLAPPAEIRVELVSGLGTRHRVAAAMTKATKCLAIVLSQSTRQVKVFRGGKEVLTISPRRSRAIEGSD